MMKRMILLAIAAVLMTVQPVGAKTVEEIAQAMGIGWNLGNTLEAGNQANLYNNKGGLGAETYWQDTRTTQAVIDYVKAQGFRSVRIPCAWVMGHISDADNYTIDAAWMARVKEIVDYCMNADLYVVLNQHWDGGWLENNIKATGETKEKNKVVLERIWTQIATEFRDYDERLLFAGLNEPNAENQVQTNNLIEYEQVFIDAVRATGGNNAEDRVLVIQGPSTDIDKTCNFMNKMPADTAKDRLMVEVHYYNPWQFWGMEKDESWGNVFYYWGADNHVSGSKHNATWGEEADMKKLLQKMYNKFVKKGIPVILGEFGANWRTISGEGESQEKHNASIKLHYKVLCELAVEMGMVPMIWDTNYRGRPSMTVINRKQLSIYNSYMMAGISEAMQTTGIEANSATTPADNHRAYNLQGHAVSTDSMQPGIYARGGTLYVKR